jgi:rare lipoprotein A
MTRFHRERATLVAALCAAIACCASGTAQAAAAETGGAVMPAVIPPTTGGDGYGAPGTRSLAALPIALLGREVNIRGTIPGAGGRPIILQRLDPRRGWRNVARSRVRTTERFEIRWHADQGGRVSLRAIVGRRGGGAEAAAAGPVVAVTVYRPAMASFFGPGLFGRQTACGLALTPDLQGVAHRRLPCGTPVLITYGGREITVPVIDRGPFSGKYSFDLTQATADALGFLSSGAIGYTRAPAP